MQQCAESDILLDNVGIKAKAGPVEAHVEVAIAIEVIWTQEDVKIRRNLTK